MTEGCERDNSKWRFFSFTDWPWEPLTGYSPKYKNVLCTDFISGQTPSHAHGYQHKLFTEQHTRHPLHNLDKLISSSGNVEAVRYLTSYPVQVCNSGWNWNVGRSLRFMLTVEWRDFGSRSELCRNWPDYNFPSIYTMWKFKYRTPYLSKSSLHDNGNTQFQ